MVKLINVDEGHIIGTISANTPISQFLDFVSSTTNTKCNMLVIFNVNGLVINESMPLSQQIPENTALYIFRKDKINLEPSIEKKDYTHFTRFPRMDYYNEPFPFADYDDFPAGYEKIPVIEKSLFELSQNAREFYAKFMVTFDYLDQTRKMQEIRLVACDILINNLKLYYNEVKNQ